MYGNLYEYGLRLLRSNSQQPVDTLIVHTEGHQVISQVIINLQRFDIFVDPFILFIFTFFKFKFKELAISRKN